MKYITKHILTFLLILSVICIAAAPITAEAATKTPAKVTISSVKRATNNKTITIKYKKVKSATGYQIAYKKTNAKKYTTKKTKKTTYKLTVTASADYNIRVRAYRKSGSKTVYGKWSAVRTVKSSKKTDSQKYSYKLTLLNKYPIYEERAAILYLETEDPNLKSLSQSISGEGGYSNGYRYDDILYADNVSHGGWCKLKSGKGYVRAIEFEKPGEKTITINEKVNGKSKKVASIKVTVKDERQRGLQFYTQVLSELTASGQITADMSGAKKMAVITKWIQTNFKYMPSDKDGNLLFLASHEGSGYDVREITCYGATTLVCDFAECLGYKARWDNAVYIDPNHYNAAVTIDGEEYIFDACPNPSGNVITSIDYFIQ